MNNLSAKAALISCFVSLVIGVVSTYFIQQYRHAEALSHVITKNEETKREFEETIRFLTIASVEQEQNIYTLSGVFDRIGEVINEEVKSINDALGMVRRIRALVESLP